MSIFKLQPSYKDYIWGGDKLKKEYGKVYDGDILAESWELSCHPDGPSTILNGAYAGKTLAEYLAAEGKEKLGSNCARFEDFPILIKFIDARDNLSIQVHPSNEYALANEGQYGKTEMWYVMDAGPDAFLYYGFEEEINKEEFAERIENDTLLEVLQAVPVHKGDVFFIEAGTIHAIGKDILIAEIQQNSNVTYRVYDYGRVGKDGKKRELHVEKALAVTNRFPAVKKEQGAHVASCEYFTVDKLYLDGTTMRKMEGYASEASFVSVLILDGEGRISTQGNDKETLAFCRGDSFFMPAGSGAYTIEGWCEALMTTVGDPAFDKETVVTEQCAAGMKSDSAEEREMLTEASDCSECNEKNVEPAKLRVGIDIGGTDTKIGLVNEAQELIAMRSAPTHAEKTSEEVIAGIAESLHILLVEQGLTAENIRSIGIGVPGMVDTKAGMVLYSNNIRWENVELKALLQRYFPVPIEIANDADCAALGEVAAGAAKDCSNMVMLTLGTGVGGGVILDGQIFIGKGRGGCELGHVVITRDGEQCTCGRKGCLEAYTSATALKRDAKRATGRDMNPKEIFDSAAAGDAVMQEIVENYIRRLGLGIVNYVNIFRPQMVLLGGGVSKQGEVLLKPIREMMAKECFGGQYGEVPQVRIAKLGNDAGMIGAANLV